MSKHTYFEDDFADECPICKAMQESRLAGKELSFEELNEAFREAKRQGHMVGGDLFDEPI